MASIICLVIAILSNIYFIALQIASPGTLAGTFFSFSSVWFWISVVCIILLIFRKHHFWKNLSRKVKNFVLVIVSAGAIISFINLMFITHPRLVTGSEKLISEITDTKTTQKAHGITRGADYYRR